MKAYTNIIWFLISQALHHVKHWSLQCLFIVFLLWRIFTIVMLFVQNISLLGDMSRLEDLCHERALQFTGFNCFQWSFNAFPAALMNLSFFNGDDSRSGSKDFGEQHARTSRRNLFDGRQWTNILLAANVLWVSLIIHVLTVILIYDY